MKVTCVIWIGGGGVEYQRKVEYFCFYSTKWITANLQWSGADLLFPADSINDTKREHYKASVVLVLIEFLLATTTIIFEEYTFANKHFNC